MSYFGDGEVTAVLLAQDGQPALGTETMRGAIVADMHVTGGRYSLYRLGLEPRSGGANPHFHRTFSESFQVLDGSPELYDGREWVTAGPGDHLFIPEGGIHAFRNPGDAPATMLMWSIPGAPREDYFAGLARFARGEWQPSEEELLAFLAEHDNHMV